MIEITWDRMNGVALPEGRVWDYVNNIIKCHKEYPDNRILLTVGCSYIIDAFRVCLKKEILTTEEIRFFAPCESAIPDLEIGLFQLPFDADGRSSVWPVGFCDLTESLLETLLWE